MASRYLLIEFDDEHSATRLREQIDNASRKGKGFRVVGLFAKPQAPYCECAREVTTRQRASTLKRGMKFGWYVCTVCKRPSSGISFLFNLVKPEEIINPPKWKGLIHYFSGIGAPMKRI